MRNETKATSISRSVKLAVWLRDHEQCVVCDRPVHVSCACAHIVRRSQGGKGIEKNVVTLCPGCHRRYDEGGDYEKKKVMEHILEFFPDWTREQVIYKKGVQND